MYICDCYTRAHMCVRLRRTHAHGYGHLRPTCTSPACRLYIGEQRPAASVLLLRWARWVVRVAWRSVYICITGVLLYHKTFTKLSVRFGSTLKHGEIAWFSAQFRIIWLFSAATNAALLKLKVTTSHFFVVHSLTTPSPEFNLIVEGYNLFYITCSFPSLHLNTIY